MSFADDPQYKIALEAYQNAAAEAQRYANEAFHAMQKAALVSTRSAQELFQRQAELAELASENWHRAGQLALEVMQEVASGMPRRPKP